MKQARLTPLRLVESFPNLVQIASVKRGWRRERRAHDTKVQIGL